MHSLNAFLKITFQNIFNQACDIDIFSCKTVTQMSPICAKISGTYIYHSNTTNGVNNTDYTMFLGKVFMLADSSLLT